MSIWFSPATRTLKGRRNFFLPNKSICLLEEFKAHQWLIHLKPVSPINFNLILIKRPPVYSLIDHFHLQTLEIFFSWTFFLSWSRATILHCTPDLEVLWKKQNIERVVLKTENANSKYCHFWWYELNWEEVY